MVEILDHIIAERLVERGRGGMCHVPIATV